MPIKNVSLHEFGVFTDLKLDFCEGINVLIGANGTGKTHLLKVLYALHSSLEHREGTGLLGGKLERIFRPDHIGRLVHRRVGVHSARVSCAIGAGHIDFEISTKERLKASLRAATIGAPSLFIPSREVLSTYEGFASLYKNREVAFDETYYDLCVALGLPALCGPRGEKAARLIEPIESALGGKVVLEGERFYVKGRDGDFEAHLVSEGFRKIAMLARLITNGALAQKGVLFWDEPEANLNPQLARVLIEFLSHLAQRDVQIFLATHDTLVAQRLSLIGEYGSKPSIRFIGFFRGEGGEIEADSGAALSDLQHNPLLEEFTRFHEDESKYFAGSLAGKVRP